MRQQLATTILVGSLLMIGGCGELTQQQQVWLAEGQRAFENKQYPQAIRKLSMFLDEVHQQPEVTQALYIRGMSHALSGLRAEAYGDLRQCVSGPEDPEVTWRAQVALGTLNFEDERWDDAGQAYGTAAKTMPVAAPLDTVLFHIGECYERTGRWSAAQASYRQLVDQLPRSNLADDARRRLQLEADHFAVQCGVFSRPENAGRQQSQLKENDVDAYVRRELRGGKTVYVVLVGRFTAYADARRQLAAVRAVVPDAVLWP